MKDKLLIFAGKVGSQRHLAAIRDSFAMLMPVLIAGSLVTLLNVLIKSAPLQGFFNSTGLQGLSNFLITINGNIWWGTFDMMTLLIVVLLAYNLTKSYGGNQIVGSVIALSAYLSIVPQAPEGGGWGSVSRAYTNASALFVGMIVTIIAVEIFTRLSKKDKLVIKMPEGVPPAVSRSFAALIPGILAIVCTTVIIYGFEIIFSGVMGVEHMTIFAIINTWVSAPLRNVADTLGAALSITFLTHLLWVFGLHGVNILEGIVQPILLPLLEENVAAYAAGVPSSEIPHIVTKQMWDTYIYMGGSGTTLGLLIAIFISSKSKAKREIAKLSVAPGIFNINEPVIFGMPIVLNPILAIPFILTPLVLTTITYFALDFNIAGRTIAVGVWSTPPILSAILTVPADKIIPSIGLQIVNLAVSVLIYLPFVKMSDSAEEKLAKEQAASAE